MKIAGLQKTTLIDYPGKIAAIVFTQGCCFRCPFCYNTDIIDSRAKIKLIPEKEVFDFFKKRQNVLEGLVITGGEPTLQADLEEWIKKVRKFGYAIKLDTNGSNPEMLKKLVTNKLIDYIAMDIKGPLDKYQKISGSKINLENIKKSVEIIVNSGIDYEFRTTVVPTLLVKEDFKKIGKLLKGAKRYFIQQFRNEKTLDKKLKKIPPYPDETLREFSEIMKKYVKKVALRGL